jgi:glycosyltransferase involved in cell wall biosynthesis
VIKKENYFDKLKIAILIPCYNEEAAIKKVVNDFQLAIPSALVYVYDNASTDKTVEIATKAGAIVRTEPNKGKGNVMRRMFSDIESDVYIIVDGDDTYEASIAPKMIEQLVQEELDMVVGIRRSLEVKKSYRRGHVFGNWLLTRAVAFLFGKGFNDMLSGYRVMSRRFVKSFPIISKGFEIETEMTIHTLQIGIPYGEVETAYNERPMDSESKLSTFRDGFRIIKMIFFLFKEEKPFQFFGLIAILLLLVSIILLIPIFSTYISTGFVPRLPTAILAMGLITMAFFSLSFGVILDSLSRLRMESKKIHYLSLSRVKKN